MADKVRINAGTEVYYKLVGSASAAVRLNEVETLGNPSQRRSEVQATPLNSDTVRYIGGLKDGQSMDITMFLLTDDVSQQGLKAAYDSNSIVEITVKPPASVDKQFRFNWTPLGHDLMLGTAGEASKRMMTGRISSDVIAEDNTNDQTVPGPSSTNA